MSPRHNTEDDLPPDTEDTGQARGWQEAKVLACFRCGPVHPDDVSPAADNEDVMIHDARADLLDGHICGVEVCWTRVIPAPTETGELERAIADVARWLDKGNSTGGDELDDRLELVLSAARSSSPEVEGARGTLALCPDCGFPEVLNGATECPDCEQPISWVDVQVIELAAEPVWKAPEPASPDPTPPRPEGRAPRHEWRDGRFVPVDPKED